MPAPVVDERRAGTRAPRDSFDELSVRALNVGRALAALAPLVTRTRLQSLNARIAAAQLGVDGAAFGVVARAVADLGDELADLARDVELCRADVIVSLARCARAELWLGVLRRGITVTELTGTCTEPLRRSTGEAWTRAVAVTSGVEARLWAGLLSWREDMLRAVARLHDEAGTLRRLTCSVERAAESHGFFIGMNALVEASRVSSAGSALAVLSLDLRDLTIDIRAAVRTASAEALALAQLARAVVDADVATAIRDLDREDG